MSHALKRSALLAVAATAVGLVVAPALPAYADTFPLTPNVETATGTNAKVDDIKLVAGKLYYVDESATTNTTTPVRTLFARTATQSAGTVSVGAQTVVASNIGSFMSASGDRYAYSNAANTQLTVKGPNARVVALDPTTTSDVKLSGSSLLVSTRVGDTLTDLVTGATKKLPANSNLWGRYAVWFNSDGSVDRRDLRTGATLRVRPAGGPSSCSLAPSPCTVANSKTSAKAWGSYVLWRFDNETKWVNTAAGLTSHALPTSKSTSVGNGLAVSRDTSVPSNLIVYELTTPTVTRPPLASNIKKFSYDDRLVAWSDANNVISVASLTPPAAATGSGRLLTGDESAAFSPNGDGSADTFTGEWDFSKPVDSWTLAITDSTGATVHTEQSVNAATDGIIRVAWNGVPDGAATPVPDGVYTWQLTGTAADGDGSLVGDDGASSGLSGTVVVRRTAPTATVSAPALSVGTPAGVSVTWKSTTAPLAGYVANRFDVAVAANGSTTYKSWLSGTTAVRGTYRATPGTTYRFRVRARDNAGNVGAWRTSGPSIVPFDDRSTALAVRGTWKALSVSAAYLHTERLATARGASVTYTGVMSGLRIVAARCAKCGRFSVVIDGKTVATIDTRATTTKARQLVYSRTISATRGKHTVRLVVQGTAGRPGFYLDGFGTLR